MNRISLLSVSCMLAVGCCTQTPLEQALWLSGENRIQLEQVLKHYSRHPEDSLKYRAACFLIENMPGHCWYEGIALNSYKSWVDSVYSDSDFVFKATLYEAFFQQADATYDLIKYEDIQNIDSNFLIVHIDSTFEAVKRRPWLKAITFEQLCEYILPYRVGHERPQHFFKWQDSLFKTEISDLLNYDDIIHDASGIFTQNQSYLHQDKRLISLFYRGQYINYRIAGCLPGAIVRNWYAKLLLCPVTLDLNPAHPNRNDRHCWSMMIDNSQINSISHIAAEKNKRGKIYRKTFSRNPYPIPDASEFVPLFFRSPFYKDITSSYTQTKDITINPVAHVNTSYGYLCVFNNMEWEPVAYAKFSNKQFHFKDVGLGVAYMPVVYQDEHPVSISYPFILGLNGQEYTLRPDTNHLMTLKLKRKYPLKHIVKSVNRNFVNSVLEASNDPGFKSKDSIGIFNHISSQQYSAVEIQSPCKYRYWRIRSSVFFTMGECIIHGPDHERILPEKQSIEGYNEAFDDNPITYAYADQQCCFTIDMKQKVALSKVECLLRNDGNSVWPGHWYELNYYDGCDWSSLGVKEAKGKFVEFDGIPCNALLWLRDLTTGREERVFTFMDGRICFW